MHTPEQLATALDRVLHQMGLTVQHDEPVSNHIDEWPAEEAEAYREHRFAFGARRAEQVRIDRLAAALHTELVTGGPEVTREVFHELLEVVDAWPVSVMTDSSIKSVSGWADGQAQPTPDQGLRIRAAHEAATLLAARFGTNAARAWFNTPAGWLDGVTPAQSLRGGGHRKVLTGARAVADGHLSAPLAAVPEVYTDTAVLRYRPDRQLIYFHTEARYDVHILQPPANGSRWSGAAMDGTSWEDTWGQGLPFRALNAPALPEGAAGNSPWPEGTVAWDRLGQVLHLGSDGWVGGLTAISRQGPPGNVAFPLTAIGRFDTELAGS